MPFKRRPLEIDQVPPSLPYPTTSSFFDMSGLTSSSGQPRYDAQLLATYHQGLRLWGSPGAEATLSVVRDWLPRYNLTQYDLPLPLDGSLHRAAAEASLTIFAPPPLVTAVQNPPMEVDPQPLSIAELPADHQDQEESTSSEDDSEHELLPPGGVDDDEVESEVEKEGPITTADVGAGPSSVVGSSVPAVTTSQRHSAADMTPRPARQVPGTPRDFNRPQRLPSSPSTPVPTVEFLARAKIVSRFSSINLVHPSYSALENKPVDVTAVSPANLTAASSGSSAMRRPHAPRAPAVLPSSSPNYKRPGGKKNKTGGRAADTRPEGHPRLSAVRSDRLTITIPKPTPPVEVADPLASSDTDEVAPAELRQSLRPTGSSKRAALSPPPSQVSSKTGPSTPVLTSASAPSDPPVPSQASVPGTRERAPSARDKIKEPPATGPRHVVSDHGLESGNPLLDLVPHLFAPPSLEDLGPAGELKCLSCIVGFLDGCTPQECVQNPSASDFARAAKHSLVPGVKPCTTCAAKHTAHCSQQKLAPLWGSMSESLHPSSLVSNSHVLSRLRHIVTEWDEVHFAKATLDRALSRWQHSVSEFAEELIIADKYFAADPDFWVSIGLASDQAAADKMLQAACDALNVPEGTSS
ncbi:hypothetical protein NP233_g929 [Leucocoprinus birnbaumii]|uniref:Uncharacterized protein n=1 Tax=Leucocoprinus birnbaumii TaxID=56174 RepID=A0AAD5YWC0_9AGAR|nr:hypothetical protein NP233_g929 [Leucocoprinus birnbaumii]